MGPIIVLKTGIPFLLKASAVWCIRLFCKFDAASSQQHPTASCDWMHSYFSRLRSESGTQKPVVATQGDLISTVILLGSTGE